MPPRTATIATALVLGGGALVGGFAAMATLPAHPTRPDPPRVTELVGDRAPAPAPRPDQPPPSAPPEDVPAATAVAAVPDPPAPHGAVRNAAASAPAPRAQPTPPRPATLDSSTCDDPKPVHCAHGARRGHHRGHKP